MNKIYIRDQFFNRVGEVDDYTSLEIIKRFNDIGAWKMELPTDSKESRLLLNPKYGISVVRNGQTVFSGAVRKRYRKWGIDSDSLILGGSDDNIHLQSLAYPKLFGSYAVLEDDVRTGIAEDVMKQYVSANIGPEARADRVTISLELNQSRGSTVTGRGRFQTLLELLQELALTGGDLGFDVATVNKALQFKVFQPADKTKSVFFSPLLGNLSSFEYSKDDPESNFLVLGGLNEGDSRIFREKGDAASIEEFGRYEEYIGNRGSEDTSEMNQKMDELLAAKAFNTRLSIAPIDTPGLTYLKHYNLGDKVSVVLTQPNEVVSQEELQVFLSSYQSVSVTNERIFKVQQKLEVIQDVIREVKITLTPDGEHISPTVGTPDSPQPGFKLFEKMKQLSRRISNMERR